MNHIDIDYCENNDIKVLSLTKDYDLINNLPSTSELAFGLMLSMLRNIPSSFEDVKVGGCTDSTAFNYDPLAECNNGTCAPIVFGCLHPLSSSYNPSANISTGPNISIINPSNPLSDTIFACDSITIYSSSTSSTSLLWNTSNLSSSVNQLFSDGFSPFDIYSKGFPLDS
mgnify:CR=1 FL=1